MIKSLQLQFTQQNPNTKHKKYANLVEFQFVPKSKFSGSLLLSILVGSQNDIVIDIINDIIIITLSF